MKRFGWGGLALQARAPGRKESFVEQDESSSEEEVYHANGTPHIYAPRPRSPRVRRGLDFDPEYRRSASFESGVGTWEDIVIPDSPPPAPARLVNDGAASELPMVSSKPPSRHTDKMFDYKQAMLSYIASGHLPSPNVTDSAHVPEATPSNTMPITIIVTSPSPALEKDTENAPNPSPLGSDLIMSRNIRKSARASLESKHLDPLPKLKMDKSRLMPPVDDQLDMRKRRKSEEFRKIRTFLIDFLNAKGDQFPMKMRVKIMGLYKIHSEDLAPDMRAKFEQEVRDEGIVLHADVDGGLMKGISETRARERQSHVESLELLKMAFRSQYLDTLPKEELNAERDLTLSQRNRRSMLPNSPYKARQSSRSRESVARERSKEDDLPSLWLPARISRLPAEHPLRVSSSVPNLQARPRRSSKSNPSSSSVPTIRTPSGSVANFHLGQSTKRRLLAGAFGAVREALRGKPRIKEGL